MQESSRLWFDDDSDERHVVEDPQAVRAALLELFGVTEEPFLRAEHMGWLEWSNRSDEFDAPSFPGTLLWGHTLRHGRAYFVQHQGWTKDDTNNFPTVISPNGKFAIGVETGDKFTGRVVRGHPPRTNSRKGVEVMRMIARNRSQLTLFPGDPSESVEHSGAPLLWMHLIHQSSGHIYGEVSLPITANHHNRIVGWKARIILPRWTNGDDLAALRANAPQPTTDAEVRIARRIG